MIHLTTLLYRFSDRVTGELWIGKGLERSSRGKIEEFYRQFLENMRKTMRHVSQDSRCAGADPNRSLQHQSANYSSDTAASPQRYRQRSHLCFGHTVTHSNKVTNSEGWQFQNNKHVARTLDFTHKWALTLNSHRQNALVQRASSYFLSSWIDDMRH